MFSARGCIARKVSRPLPDMQPWRPSPCKPSWRGYRGQGTSPGALARATLVDSLRQLSCPRHLRRRALANP
eukprot:2556047-Pyramimonas_sp.AAC.1